MELLEVLAAYVPLYQTLIWVVLILIALVIFLPQLKSVLETMRTRIESGSSFKAGPVELGEDIQNLQSIDDQTNSEPIFELEADIDPAGITSEASPVVSSHDELIRELNDERKTVYNDNRNLFLTHVIRPTTEQGQKYEVFIYLIRHHGQNFEDVESAEFFLGPYWRNRVFQRKEQNGKIGLSTAAYGTFLCTCWVKMKDNEKIFLTRYIDFEMGRVFKEKA